MDVLHDLISVLLPLLLSPPDDTHNAIATALKAGADGLILSRKYSEMQLANLAAAGRAVREG